MSSAVTNIGRPNDERWRFWRDVLVFNLKVLLGNLRDFALIPVSLVAALIDVVSKGEQEGSLFYRVLRWGAHSDEVLDAYSPVKDHKTIVKPDYTVDALIGRIESVMVREYEKGGTAASIKTALDRVIDQVQRGTGGHRERVQGAVTKASEKLPGLRAGGQVQPRKMQDAGGNAIKIRSMTETDSAAVAELASELGYPVEDEEIRRRIERIGAADILLVAVDSTGRVVGFIQAHRVCIMAVGFLVEILGLVVSAKARRLGIGKGLIARVEDWAKNAGAEAVVVRSNTKRTESHIFYPAIGYGMVKTQAVYKKQLSVPAQTEAGIPQEPNRTQPRKWREAASQEET